MKESWGPHVENDLEFGLFSELFEEKKKHFYIFSLILVLRNGRQCQSLAANFVATGC